MSQTCMHMTSMCAASSLGCCSNEMGCDACTKLECFVPSQLP